MHLSGWFVVVILLVSSSLTTSVRVVVTFSSAEDRLVASFGNHTDWTLEKSYGRRHVLDLPLLVTLTEAEELLSMAYAPIYLFSVEEDLPIYPFLLS